jgi:hypothetical protein
MTVSIMPLSTLSLGVTLRINNTWQNKALPLLCLVSRFISYYAKCDYAECYAECDYAECHYAECHYAECHYAEYRGALFMPQRK